MNLDTLAPVSLSLAGLPAAIFALNLLVYRPLPKNCRSQQTSTQPLSVLIPARNEEQNLAATLAAVLANHDAVFEVIVLDDHSTDRTRQIAMQAAARDSRVRVQCAPPLPDGWCGKQHACQVLARLAQHQWLVFIDADVRLGPNALSRMAAFMSETNTALASGVPRQELGTFSERLLLPLIHFILLGFLPMHAMRRTRWPSMSAGCGQLFIAHRDAYHQSGGHAALRHSLHDGIMLPRVFRRAGLRTDLFDATDLATCRMYRTNAETWRGLSKNATEGLGAPGTIGPMTLLLLGGQVVPFALLLLAPVLSPRTVLLSSVAALLAYLPRLIAARRFQQPIGNALLHPLGMLALVGIQWHARWRQFAGKPSAWKGRNYSPVTTSKELNAS